MLRLSRTLRRRRRDRGAVAALVAVLLAGNALLGMGALTIDVGLLYVEREQLQSGADAAARAIAKVCMANTTQCRQNPMTALAVSYANDNARDGQSNATVCGRLPSDSDGSLSPCGLLPDNLTACLGSRPSSPAPFVEVYTSTSVDGDTALPPVFGTAVTGSSGTTVGACARVTWGPVGRAPVLPLAISICKFTGARNSFGLQPPPSGGEHVATNRGAEQFADWDKPEGGGCSEDGGLHNMPFGFGWLAGSGGDCEINVSVGEWYDGRVVTGTPSTCISDLVRLRNDKQPVPVPIFNLAHEEGHRDQFHIAGIAMFVVTGWWKHPGWPSGPGSQASTFTTRDDCGGPELFCVFGYFTTGLILGAEGAPGNAPYGTAFIRTIG